MNIKEIDSNLDINKAYKKYNNRSCNYYSPVISNRNDLGTKINTLEQCGKNCMYDKDCVSFYYSKDPNSSIHNQCNLSSNCYDGNFNPNDNKYDLYVKQTVNDNNISNLKDYNKFPNYNCPNSTSSIPNSTPKDCADRCKKDISKCVSFSYDKNSKVCNLANKCHEGNLYRDGNTDSYITLNKNLNAQAVKNAGINDVDNMDSPSKNRMIKLAGTNMCMNMTGRVGNGQNIFLWRCNPNDKNERFWYYKPLQQVRTKNGNYSLNFDHSPHKGTSIIQWQGINDWSNRLIYNKNTKSFKSPYKDQCVTNSNNRNVNSNNIISWDCINGNTNKDQEWEIGVFDSNGKPIPEYPL